MKKQHFFIFLAATLLAAGCTTKEQDQQIRLFWMRQYTNLMMKKAGNMPRPTRHLPAPAGLVSAQKAHAPAAQNAPQLIDVTLETDALPGKAPHADRVRMKRAWNAVQMANQKAVDDINTAFGAQVKTKAFLITANTEKQLKQEAKEAADFNAYFARQRDLLAKQEQELTRLMTQNRSSIRKLKKTNANAL